MYRYLATNGSRVLLASVLLLGCHSAGSFIEAGPSLTAGNPQRMEIRAGEVHRFRVPLTEDRFLRVYATQKGVDLALTLIAPGGETIAVADGAGPSIATEVLVALTEPAGTYRVEVVAKDTAEEMGLYEIGLAENRERLAGDEDRLAALRMYIRAHQLVGPDATPDDRKLALRHLQEATSSLRKIDDPLVGWSMFRSAQIHLDLGQAEEARDESRLAIAALDRVGLEGGKVGAYNCLGDALVVLDEPDEALMAYSNAIRIAEGQGVVEDLAINLNDRAILYRQLGDLEAAKRDLQRALALWNRFAVEQPHVEITSHQVTAIINLGVVHRKLGETEQALDLYERAAGLAEKTSWSADELHLFTNLGRAYIATGRLQEAHETLTRGLVLARDLQKTEDEQAILANLGLLYRLLGQSQAALASYREARAAAYRLQRSDEIAESLLGIGQVQREIGELESALESFRQALQASEDSASVPLQAESLREIGSTLAELGSPTTGLSTLHQGLALVADSPPAMVADHLIAMAAVQQQLGQLDEARSTLLRAADLNLTLEDPVGYGLIHARLGRLEHRMGARDAAARSLDIALTTYEELRARLVSPDQRATFLARWRDLYRDLIDLLIGKEPDATGQGDGPSSVARALAVSERSRARVLVELLAEARINVREKIDAGLLEQERALLTRVSLLQSDLLESRTGEDDAQRRRDRRALKEALAELETLEQRIHREHRSYADLRYPEPLDADGVQSLLPPDAALLEYVLGPERSHLFIVSRSGISYHPLPGAREIRTEIRTLRETIHATDPRSTIRFEETRTRLSRWLLPPPAARLTQFDRLWVVPDGALYYLPFELLSIDDELHVLDRWTIGYVPSATTLVSLDRPDEVIHRAADFVAFAAPTGGVIDASSRETEGMRREGARRTTPRFRPLPASEEEVRQIAALFPSRSLLFIGSDANKSNLYGEPSAQTARWLHLASHAWIDEQEPSRSAIVLSPDPNGDVLLPVADIFNLRLSAEAVVLSACETGLGGEVDGEGLVGFTRAFFYAGTPNVVVSLWPVADEATSALMQRFYAGLSVGRSIAQALGQAKRKLIAETTWTHPRYWASFILVGGLPEQTIGNIDATGTAHATKDVN